ncbi:hypothetical protein ACRAWD_26930 [Caulobacter segnis]
MTTYSFSKITAAEAKRFNILELRHPGVHHRLGDGRRDRVLPAVGRLRLVTS